MQPAPRNIERRRFQRTRLATDILLNRDLVSFDISENGMAFRSKSEIGIGANLHLDLQLADDAMEISANVVWRIPRVPTPDVEEYMVGVFFVGLSTENRRKLARFVEAVK